MKKLLVLLVLVLVGCGDRKPMPNVVKVDAPAGSVLGEEAGRTWLTNEENGAITYGPAPESYGTVVPKPKDVESENASK